MQQKVFVDGELVRAEADGSTVYLIIKQKTGGTWRVAVRDRDIRRVLRGQPYDESTAAFAARRLHRRWVRLSSMQSPSPKEAREKKRERKMKVTIGWVLNKELANLEPSGEDAKTTTTWDAWSITKALIKLADEEDDFFAMVDEVGKDQCIVRPKGHGTEGWAKKQGGAKLSNAAGDSRLALAIDALSKLEFVHKITKVSVGQ